MADHDMFEVVEVTNEEDAIHLAVFYRKLLGMASDVEDMLAGYLVRTGKDSFTVGSVTIADKDGAKTYDHRGAIDAWHAAHAETHGDEGAASEIVNIAIEEATQPKTSWSKVTTALGIKRSDIPFNEGPPRIVFTVDGATVRTVERPDKDDGPDYGEDPIQPAVNVHTDDEIPF